VSAVRVVLPVPDTASTGVEGHTIQIHKHPIYDYVITPIQADPATYATTKNHLLPNEATTTNHDTTTR